MPKTIGILGTLEAHFEKFKENEGKEHYGGWVLLPCGTGTASWHRAGETAWYPGGCPWPEWAHVTYGDLVLADLILEPFTYEEFCEVMFKIRGFIERNATRGFRA